MCCRLLTEGERDCHSETSRAHDNRGSKLLQGCASPLQLRTKGALRCQFETRRVGACTIRGHETAADLHQCTPITDRWQAVLSLLKGQSAWIQAVSEGVKLVQICASTSRLLTEGKLNVTLVQAV